MHITEIESKLNNIIGSTKVEARDYQKRIIVKTVNELINEGCKSVIIESATGSGKSVMGLLLCKLMEEIENVKIGWIAHRKFLLKQARTENVIKGINTNINTLSIFEKQPNFKADMLLIDECQHDATASATHLHSILKPRYIVGLSAHPFRTDRIKLCFDKKITDAGIQELIKMGYLSKYQHWTITKRWCPETVCEFYLREKEKWGKTIMYFHTIADCLEAGEILHKGGTDSEIITGSSKEFVQLARFRKGEVNVVINCMKLTEGLDIPELNTVFIRPACKSVTIQCGGRVFRKHPNIAWKNVVQCNRTKWPFLRTAMPMKQHMWEYDRWASLTPNDNARYAGQLMQQAIAQIEVKLPDLLTNRKKNRRTSIADRFNGAE